MEITTQQVLNLNSAIFQLHRSNTPLNKYLGYRLVVLSEKIAPHIEAYKKNIEGASEEDIKRILDDKVDMGKTEPINLKDLPDEVTMDVIMNFKKSGLLTE